MTAISSLYSLILLFSVVCIAEVITLERQSPFASNQVDVPERNNVRTIGNSNPAFSNLQLLDIVLIASVDGKIRAVNRGSGQSLWTMSAPSTTQSAKAFNPLVQTSFPNETAVHGADQEIYIIEPQSGDIYVMATPSGQLQRFPYSMSELVDLSPLSIKGEEEDRVFIGKKSTSLLLVELETGKIRATLNTECPWEPYPDSKKGIDLDDLEGDTARVRHSTEVFIGRTDYHISIVRSTHNTEPKPTIELSFSAYGPNNQDNPLQSTYKRTMDDIYIQSLPSGEVMSFKAGIGKSPPQDQPLWALNFDSPIVAVFDVFQNPTISHSSTPYTFVLLQPNPGLSDLLPSLSVDTARGHLPNSESAFVGMMDENGSLFAMTPSHFPLVAFGGQPKRGYLGIGAPGSTTDLPGNVDDITRLRKERDEFELLTAKCQANPFQRMCLVGVRKLEGGDGEGPESRLRRLLDGPEPSPSVVELPSPTPTPTHDLQDDNVQGWLKANVKVWATFITVLVASVWFAVGIRGKHPIRNVQLPPPILLPDNQIEITSPLSTARPITPPALEIEVLSWEPEEAVLPSSSVNGDDDGEESDNNAEDEPGMSPQPGRRKTRRRKRGGGKRKKIQLPASEAENVDPEHSPEIMPSPLTPAIQPTQPVATSSLVVSDVVLGFGSHGTVVFKGSFQGRAVAVKRLLQDFVTLASREVNILQESDDHPNVIRYYYQEAHATFLYIALELCPASLADIIECHDKEELRDILVTFNPKRALKEITGGLRHLHALKLVHRDIKPQNILISNIRSGGGRNGGYRMLISDFGLCKKLDLDQTSFMPTAYGAMAAGTVGWRAPEILRGDVKLDVISDDQSISSSRGSTGTVNGATPTPKQPKLTKAVDIFALGCLFYYTLTNGTHPFGDRYEREVNILKNAKNLDGLESLGEEGSEAVDLIRQMLDPEASHRPDTTTCLLHPFFWDPGRRLNFLQDASDRFEIMCRDPKDPNLIALEQNASAIVGNDWQARCDKVFLENLGKFRKYDGKSVQDLLRALRNKKHHYQDLPDSVKRHLGSMPEGYLAYFTRRYPRLFLHVHSVVRDTSLRFESMFRSYFELPD